MFVIYSKPGCAYCDKAKALLSAKGLKYEERLLDVGQPKVEDTVYYTLPELQALVPGARTVPQIFEGKQYIGTFTDLQVRLLGE